MLTYSCRFYTPTNCDKLSELDMPDFLIMPRGALPHRLIKALRVPPRLCVE